MSRRSVPKRQRRKVGRGAPAPSHGTTRDAEDLFPPEFRERIQDLLGDESEAFFAALADPPTGLRVNTLRLSPEEFRSISPFELESLAFPPEGFRVDAGTRPGRHPYHAAGLYYLQDPGAMAVAALLDPQPGERVLDLAAAPGGKSTHIAARMQDEGLLVANDVHPARTRELAGNLERCGVRNAVVTLESAERLADHFGAWFDRVLLDAPCSGEAMFHKSEAARAEWSPAAVAGCARRQVDLLADAARLVRPGGCLVYSTCTFSPEEDEQVIARFLRDNPDYELVELTGLPGALPGNPAWVPPELCDPALVRTLRLWPHRVPGAGHFVAGLRRVAGAPGEPPRAPRSDIPRAALALWEAFRNEHLAGEESSNPPPLRPPTPLLLRGAELYRLPEAAPDLGRLRVERPGWWLGTLQKNRFEPAHALALGLARNRMRNALDLDPDDPAVEAYLRGETISSAGPAGWVIVRANGYALGWGKRVGDRVKNHFPKGLRWN
jgi:NOL1/NOP2/sun family putative RNA methylase